MFGSWRSCHWDMNTSDDLTQTWAGKVMCSKLAYPCVEYGLRVKHTLTLEPIRMCMCVCVCMLLGAMINRGWSCGSGLMNDHKTSSWRLCIVRLASLGLVRPVKGSANSRSLVLFRVHPQNLFPMTHSCLKKWHHGIHTYIHTCSACTPINLFSCECMCECMQCLYVHECMHCVDAYICVFVYDICVFVCDIFVCVCVCVCARAA